MVASKSTVLIGFVLKECPFSDEALTDVSVSPRPLVLHLKRDILSGLNESFHSNSELPNSKNIFLTIFVGQNP